LEWLRVVYHAGNYNVPNPEDVLKIVTIQNNTSPSLCYNISERFDILKQKLIKWMGQASAAQGETTTPNLPRLNLTTLCCSIFEHINLI